MSAFEAAAAAEGAPKGVLVVDILSARGLSGMGGFGDTIDAFATVEIDGADEPFGKTETLSDETKPVWNARFVTLVPAEAETFTIKICDQDTMSSSSKASVTVNLGEAGEPLSATLDLDPKGKVTVNQLYLPMEMLLEYPGKLDELEMLQEDDAADEAEKEALQEQMDAIVAAAAAEDEDAAAEAAAMQEEMEALQASLAEAQAEAEANEAAMAAELEEAAAALMTEVADDAEDADKIEALEANNAALSAALAEKNAEICRLRAKAQQSAAGDPRMAARKAMKAAKKRARGLFK